MAVGKHWFSRVRKSDEVLCSTDLSDVTTYHREIGRVVPSGVIDDEGTLHELNIFD